MKEISINKITEEPVPNLFSSFGNGREIATEVTRASGVASLIENLPMVAQHALDEWPAERFNLPLLDVTETTLALNSTGRNIFRHFTLGLVGNPSGREDLQSKAFEKFWDTLVQQGVKPFLAVSMIGGADVEREFCCICISKDDAIKLSSQLVKQEVPVKAPISIDQILRPPVPNLDSSFGWHTGLKHENARESGVACLLDNLPAVARHALKEWPAERFNIPLVDVTESTLAHETTGQSALRYISLGFAGSPGGRDDLKSEAFRKFWDNLVERGVTPSLRVSVIGGVDSAREFCCICVSKDDALKLSLA